MKQNKKEIIELKYEKTQGNSVRNNGYLLKAESDGRVLLEDFSAWMTREVAVVEESLLRETETILDENHFDQWNGYNGFGNDELRDFNDGVCYDFDVKYDDASETHVTAYVVLPEGLSVIIDQVTNLLKSYYYHAKEKIKKPRRSFEEMWEEIINESHELPEKKDTKISMSDFLDAVLSDDDTAADSLFKQRPYMDI